MLHHRRSDKKNFGCNLLIGIRVVRTVLMAYNPYKLCTYAALAGVNVDNTEVVLWVLAIKKTSRVLMV